MRKTKFESKKLFINIVFITCRESRVILFVLLEKLRPVYMIRKCNSTVSTHGGILKIDSSGVYKFEIFD